MNPAKPRPNLWLYGYVGLIFAFVFTPIITTVVFAFDVNRYPSLPMGGLTLDWFRQVLADASLSRGVRTSLSVALCSAVVATALGFAGAYVDYRYRFMGKNLYLALLTLPPLVPVVILGLAMLTFQSRIGLAGSVQGLIVGHIVLCAPFALALIRMRLASLDPDIEAAAWNLGATQLSTLRSVILPFCLPTILACLFLTAAVSFDEFMIAWFVGGTNETLPVRVLAMLQGQVSPRINAVGTLVFGLSIALVLISQLFNPGRRGRTQN